MDSDVVAATLKFRGDAAKFHIEVQPPARRKGVATTVLAQLTETARAHGVKVLYSWAERGSPGEAFLAARLERVRGGELWSELDLRTAVLPPSTRDFTSWTGPCPAELAAAFALCHEETGADYEPDEIAARLTVAAFDGRRMIGFSQASIDGSEAHQEWTGVVPSHRGQGAASALKAEIIRKLGPQVTRLRTENSSANTHILAANARLGFRVYRDLVAWETAL